MNLRFLRRLLPALFLFFVSHSLVAAWDLKGMGNNTDGRIGTAIPLGTATSSPALIETGVIQVSAGSAYCLFLKNDGGLWAMGGNDAGQLGDGTYDSRPTPQLVANDVVQCSAGNRHAMFVNANGELWGSGNNIEGEIGANPYAYSYLTPVKVDTNVTQVSAGERHSIFLKKDGSLWGIGSNQFGQLGIAESGASNPVKLVASGVVKIAAGGRHSLFLKDDGTIWIISGQRTQVADHVTDIAAGMYHSLFLKDDGTLWGVGGNSYGELGDGTFSQRYTPVQITAGVSKIFTSANSLQSMFIKADGSLWATGRNDNGELGDGTTITRNTPVHVADGAIQAATGWCFSVFLQVPQRPVITKEPKGRTIGAGQTVELTVEATSSLPLRYQWYYGAKGNTSNPAAGATSAAWVTAPILNSVDCWVRVSNDSGFSDSQVAGIVVTPPPSITRQPDGTLVSSDENAVLYVESSGLSLSYQWYRGTKGDISSPLTGATGPLLVLPQLYQSLSVWLRITNPAGTADSNVAYVEVEPPSGTEVWATGDNTHGEFGDGSTVSRYTPLRVATGVFKVATNDHHSAHMIGDGALFCMGYNGNGELGDGTTTTRIQPTGIATDVAQVSTGSGHTLFVKNDTSLWGCGEAYHGELSPTFVMKQTTPTQIGTGVASAIAGRSFSLFVGVDGKLWAMGANDYGQLGDGTIGTKLEPTLIATDVVAASAGGYHSLFVKRDRTLWAMGQNYNGQLGDGSAESRNQPVQIATDVIRCSAGTYHSLFLKADGSLWGMGANGGTLGDGTTTERHSPVHIANGVSRICAGDRHSCFTKTDGSAWAMGYLSALGTGYPEPDQYFSTTPVEVMTDITQIAAGSDRSLFLRVPAPSITKHPAMCATRIGSDATFAVEVNCEKFRTYQWRKGGQDINGATSRTLLLSNVQLTDAAQYEVVVTGGGVSITSNPARLIVHNEAYISYQSWADAQAAVGGPLGDVNGTGLPNLLRYAFKLPAHGQVSAPTSVQVVPVGGSDYLAITFTRKTYAPDLRYFVEASSNMIEWSVITSVEPGYPEVVVVPDDAPIAGTVRRFLRVRVEIGP